MKFRIEQLNNDLKFVIKSFSIFILLLSSVVFSNADQAKTETSKTCFYLKTARDQAPVRFTLRYASEEIDGKKFYSYFNQHPEGQWQVLSHTDGRPIHIIVTRKKNRLEFRFEEEGRVHVQGNWDSENVNKLAKFHPNVSPENLMYLRTINLNNGEKFVFDILRPDKFPKLKAYRMFYRVEGEETVVVKAGVFRCKKVLFGCDEIFLRPFYHSYFYVSDDENRYFVKEENLTRNFTVQLERVE